MLLVKAITYSLAQRSGPRDSHRMGTVHKFQRPPKNKGQIRCLKPAEPPGGPKRKWRWEFIHSLLVLVGLAAAIALVTHLIAPEKSEAATFIL